jgi:WD40 repeat protein
MTTNSILKNHTVLYLALYVLLATGLQAADFIELKNDRFFGEFYYAVAFSPDGKKVATLDMRVIQIWDTDSGKELQRIVGDFGNVLHGGSLHSYALVFSPDGKKIAQIGKGKIAQILDIDSGKIVQTIQGHEGPLQSITFSPDGTKLVTSSYDKTARIWDADTGKELQKLEGHTGFVLSAIFLPNGKEVLTRGSSGPITITQTVNGITETFDAADDRTARIWDADSGKELRQLEGYKDHGTVALSPDGTKFAMVLLSVRPEIPRQLQTYLVVHDADSGEELCKSEIDSNHIEGVAMREVGIKMPAIRPMFPLLHSLVFVFTPDGKRIVTASHNDPARLFDAESGQELRQWGNRRGYTSAAISQDGKKIALINFDKTAEIWDVEALLRPTRPAIGDF